MTCCLWKTPCLCPFWLFEPYGAFSDLGYLPIDLYHRKWMGCWELQCPLGLVHLPGLRNSHHTEKGRIRQSGWCSGGNGRRSKQMKICLRMKIQKKLFANSAITHTPLLPQPLPCKTNTPSVSIAHASPTLVEFDRAYSFWYPTDLFTFLPFYFSSSFN